MVAGVYWYVTSPLKLTAATVEFQVTYGQSVSGVAKQIRGSGVLLQPKLFGWLVRVLKVDASLKAGSYEVHQGVSMLDLISKLTRGDVTQGDVLLVEGWTFAQIRSRLNANSNLKHDSVALSDQEILELIGAPEHTPEGLFYPDTYLFDKQASDLDVLARAYRAMGGHLAHEWPLRDQGLPYHSPYEALVMASLIEKETARESDRTKIAAVFINRLHRGMRLQTDPAVIYGLGKDFDGNLKRRDLQNDHPFNTYTRAGLPPTPIAMPGIASIRAALHPAKTNALYFVARGDGSSQFSESLDAHNEAVNQFQRHKKPSNMNEEGR